MEQVVVKKCDSYNADEVEKVLKEVFGLLGGIERYIKPGMKVVIKPNLIMKKRPEDAATTHPAVVRAVAKLVVSLGASVVIAESPGGVYTKGFLEGIYIVCGYKELEKTGVVLNYDTSVVDIPVSSGKITKRLTVIKPIADADLVISVSKLKTHGMTIMTGAVKNYFGIIPGALKAEYHARMPKHDDFADMLVDIAGSVKNQINIVDGVIGMEGPGPTAGYPRKIGCILAGTNPYAVDVVCADIMGLRDEDVPTITSSYKRGLVSKDEIEVIGDKVEDVRVKDFLVPGAVKREASLRSRVLKLLTLFIRPKPVFIHSKCIGCQECVKNCPAKVIVMKNKRPCPDLRKCIRCFCCQELCPVKAVEISRPRIFKFFVPKSEHRN